MRRKWLSWLSWLWPFGKKATLPERQKQLPPPPKNWRGTSSVAVGDKHLRTTPPVPCQDAAFVCVESKRRPCAFVADGAGSAERSHLGSELAVLSLSRLLSSLEAEGRCVRLLDDEAAPAEADWDALARECIEDVSTSLRGLAGRCGMPFKKFHCTLLGAVVGHKRIFWFHVGDGYIVAEKAGQKLQVVGAEEKSGYANVTHFVKENAATTEIRHGVIPANEITGLALMTDGAAEKLVASNGNKVAGRVNKFLAEVRSDEFDSGELHRFLSNADIWKPGQGYTGDDRGMALLAKVL